jgi:hypothetical protein
MTPKILGVNYILLSSFLSLSSLSLSSSPLFLLFSASPHGSSHSIIPNTVRMSPTDRSPNPCMASKIAVCIPVVQIPLASHIRAVDGAATDWISRRKDLHGRSCELVRYAESNLRSSGLIQEFLNLPSGVHIYSTPWVCEKCRLVL